MVKIRRNAVNHIEVAIVGGGITGVILALALQKRNVSYKLYERAPAFTEIGAGIGFSPNAERALQVVDPAVYKLYKSVASTNPDIEWFTWIDGNRTNKIITQLEIGVDAFQGGRRSDFLEAWSKLIPTGKVGFNREIESIVQRDEEGGGRAVMKFRDGSIEEADVVIGCDGIRSRVRQLILGEANPASYPRYTQKFCYRALVPMDHALPILGPERTRYRFMYNGQDAHGITYSVAQGKLLNILFVVTDKEPWTAERHIAPGSREDLAKALRGWHPNGIRGLIDLLPERLDKWAIFDMHEHPAPYYNAGSVAIAGDAAHASGPHLGSGAGFGIEDALVLAVILKQADEKVASIGGRDAESVGERTIKGNGKQKNKSKVQICRDALAAYNDVRFARGQWLPGATREAVELFQWQDPKVADDGGKLYPRVHSLYHTIWDNDIDEMVRDAENRFRVVVER
ncbi:hypothetical protein F5Y16DRAFT_410570 [Xylariaceae sp. FL0255]|nr:hypothetical protein F5Y16DRAFT_410570 [Xylariaceae sp. FL0255]